MTLLTISTDEVQAAANPTRHAAVPLRQLYEVCRISTQTGVPLHGFAGRLDQRIDDYASLWSDLSITAEKHALSMPEKCSLAAWKQGGQDFKGVALTGSLSFVDQPSDQIFEFKLNPLKMEPTYRLARKFGHDRFFLLNIPSIHPNDMPHHLRADPNARTAILDWLVHSEHTFLGRKWRAFYVRNQSRKKVGTRSAFRAPAAKPSFRVYMFAELGSDLPLNSENGGKGSDVLDRSPMTRKDLIEWFMPAKDNKKQRALKFFARLALGRCTLPHTLVMATDVF